MSKSKITTDIVKVTPKVAEEWYILSGGNRPIDRRHVTFLAGEMQQGKWRMNGESLKFDEEGKLIDGHHRLVAAAENGLSFTTQVVRGLPLDARDTIDTGRSRSGRDALAFAHTTDKIPNLDAVTVTLSRLIDWEKSRLHLAGKGGKTTNSEIVEAYDRYPDVGPAINAVRKCKVITYSRTAWLYYLVAQHHRDEIEEFFARLADGCELPQHSPIAALRTRLFRAAQMNRSIPLGECLALLVKAWNAYLLKKPVQTLRWQASEGFPQIAGLGRKK